MTKLLTASALCSALLFLGLATPIHAATITFSSTTQGGDLTTLNLTGNPDPVTGIGFPTPDPLETIDHLTITGDGAANGVYSIFLQEMYNGGTNGTNGTETLTIFGTITGFSQLPGLTTTSNLATIVFSSAGLTANATTSAVSVNFPTNVVSITLGSAFAADLGIGTTLSPAALTALTDIGNSVGAVGGNYNLTSASLTLTTAVPEPGSWMLMALGAAFVVVGARKNRRNADV